MTDAANVARSVNRVWFHGRSHLRECSTLPQVAALQARTGASASQMALAVTQALPRGIFEGADSELSSWRSAQSDRHIALPR